MGKPLLGEDDREFSEHRCVCCWRVVVPKRNQIPVCVECVDKLTLGERASIVFAVKQTELLGEMRGLLRDWANKNESDEDQLARIARTFEKFGISLNELIKRMDERSGRPRSELERKKIGG